MSNTLQAKSYNRLPNPRKTFLLALAMCAALAALISYVAYSPDTVSGFLLVKILRIEPPSRFQLCFSLALLAAPIAGAVSFAASKSFHNGVFAGPKAAADNSHGSARLLSSPRDLKETFDVWEGSDAAPAAGVVVGGIGDDPCRLLTKQTPHALVLGSTGAGKTVSCLFPTIANMVASGSNAVVLDPKGECHALFAGYARSRGYDVYHLDFANPRQSHGWNPLQPSIDCARGLCGRSADELLAELRALAGALMPREPRTAPIWRDNACAVFCGAAAAVVGEPGIDDTQRNLSSVAAVANLPQDALLELAESLADGSAASVPLSRVAAAAPETYAGFISNLNAAIGPFCDPGITAMTGRNDVCASDLADPERKVLVFIGFDGANAGYTPLVSAFVSSMMRSLTRIAAARPGKRLPRDVYWLLEEFGQLPQMEGFAQHLMVMRSAGQHAIVVAQSLAAIEDVYGPKCADSIIDNLGTTVYLNSNSPATQKRLSAQLGTYTYVAEGSSKRGLAEEPCRSSSMQGAPLLRPEDLAKWDWRTGHLVICDGQAYACSSLAVHNCFVGDDLGLDGREPTGSVLAELAPAPLPKRTDAPAVWQPKAKTKGATDEGADFGQEAPEGAKLVSRASFDPRIM